MGKFDFLKAEANEIDEYVMGKLIWQSQELSHILIGHLMIEGLLGALIAKSLPQPEQLMEQRNLTFDLKLNLANALGLLPAEHFAGAKALNKIRNQYSHNPDYEIKLDDLSPFKFGWEDIQKQAFEVAKTKGIADATQISIIFLSFAFQALLKNSTEPRELR
jgi:hypothetical protein